LCNQKGAAYYQWKWDELRFTDYQKFQDDLLVDVIQCLFFYFLFFRYIYNLLFVRMKLNEYVRLEYKNPSNIKLKFTHNRETLEYDLSAVKENQSKISNLVT